MGKPRKVRARCPDGWDAHGVNDVITTYKDRIAYYNKLSQFYNAETKKHMEKAKFYNKWAIRLNAVAIGAWLVVIVSLVWEALTDA